MLKNAWLSSRKNIGKTVLLFVIMAVIANLIIAGLSIQSASKKSMEQIRSSLGNDVTLSVNMKNMMQNREKGQSLSEVKKAITTTMADQLKSLNYVENYNYNISTSANSNSVTPVESEINNDMPGGRGEEFGDTTEGIGEFTIEANQSMENISNFTSGDYELIEGRLLTSEDKDTNHCVIETNLASDNTLSVGDTITIYRTINGEQVSQELVIVGIYEMTSSQQLNGPNRSNPINMIYTDLSVGQTLTGSTTELTSATFYIDDPENIDAFIDLAKEKTDIDFETYTLDANDQLYQRNVANLENTESFATMFLLVVVIAGSAILCLILILTIRGRFYEIGVFLSLGQSKIKIIGQQLLEVGIIAIVAFVISLGTGKMVSNVVSNMLEQSQSDTTMQMEMPSNHGDKESGDGEKMDRNSALGNRPSFENAFSGPENQELDVSLTATTIVQLAGITAGICIISIIIPSLYILRLSPREILIKKEG